MQCPTCGAEIQRSDQQYCHECGASLSPQKSMLPTTKVHGPMTRLPADRSSALQTRPAAHDLLAGVLPNSFQNRVVVGGVTVVVAIFAVWMLINAVVSLLLHVVLPGVALVAIIYVGIRYLMRSRSA
jgi:hypothetical protein